MSVEDRLQPLEQLVTVMQSDVLLARGTAAQAEQRAADAESRSLTVRSEGVVDARLFGKPKSFDGTSDSWRQFKFTFLGYAGVVDMRLKQAKIESQVLTELAITNAALPPRDQRVSTQLCHVLFLLLEGSHAARSCPIASRSQWSRKASRTKTSGATCSCMQHAFSSYTLVREEIRSIIMARDTLSGLAPLDVSAVYEGKGKGKEGKGKAAVPTSGSSRCGLVDTCVLNKSLLFFFVCIFLFCFASHVCVFLC